MSDKREGSPVECGRPETTAEAVCVEDAKEALYMRRALKLARRGWGRVSPNPMVGAVVVSGGEIVGEGCHAEFGADHAEVVALREAGDRAAGSTLYVNLEPCSHWGKTPPCTEAIVAAGVRRVVWGCADPTAEAGGGSEHLETAGIAVRGHVEEEAARSLNAPWLWWATAPRQRPFVAVKLALSLDAKLSRAPGVRTAVTGPGARAEVHRLRAGFDGILTGRGTVEADDPLLTVRGPLRPRRPPVRIVLDSHLGMSPHAALVGTREDAPVWVVGSEEAAADRRKRLESAGIRVLTAPRRADGLDPVCVLERLAAAGIRTLLVEAGGRIVGSLLRRRLVDRLYLFYAPILFGQQAPDAFPVGEPVQAGELRVVDRRAVGADTLVVLERSSLASDLAGG